jgi:hypothetical protein
MTNFTDGVGRALAFEDKGTPAFTADCGHEIAALAPGYTGGTGYAVTRDGRKICYQCAVENERKSMIETGRTVLYLVSRSPSPSKWHITDWASQLDFPAFNITRSEGYGFGRRYPIVTGRFRGPDGKLWVFRNACDNQIARCRRLKDAR